MPLARDATSLIGVVHRATFSLAAVNENTDLLDTSANEHQRSSPSQEHQSPLYRNLKKKMHRSNVNNCEINDLRGNDNTLSGILKT